MLVLKLLRLSGQAIEVQKAGMGGDESTERKPCAAEATSQMLSFPSLAWQSGASGPIMSLSEEKGPIHPTTTVLQMAAEAIEVGNRPARGDRNSLSVLY